jgi:elongation factor Ts
LDEFEREDEMVEVVSAALVKELRDKTGAGMMDCKRALGDTGGDIEAAVDWLRKKGLAAAAKKAGRVAAEGLVGVATKGLAGAVVEVNSETDFVARNSAFQSFVKTASEIAVGNDGELESLKRAPFPGSGRTVKEELTHLISTIGENLVLRRLARLAVEEGIIASYVHNTLGHGIGKIGVIVALASAAPQDALAALGKQLAMHVAAANPLYLDIASVPEAALEREREVLREQARGSGKPDAIIERMVEGRLRKFYEETVLLEQIFVVDQETKIAAVVEAAAKTAGKPIRVSGFARFALGEGIERPRGDFAAEVAAQLKH